MNDGELKPTTCASDVAPFIEYLRDSDVVVRDVRKFADTVEDLLVKFCWMRDHITRPDSENDYTRKQERHRDMYGRYTYFMNDMWSHIGSVERDYSQMKTRMAEEKAERSEAGRVKWAGMMARLIWAWWVPHYYCDYVWWGWRARPGGLGVKMKKMKMMMMQKVKMIFPVTVSPLLCHSVLPHKSHSMPRSVDYSIPRPVDYSISTHVSFFLISQSLTIPVWLFSSLPSDCWVRTESCILITWNPHQNSLFACVRRPPHTSPSYSVELIMFSPVPVLFWRTGLVCSSMDSVRFRSLLYFL